MANLIKLTCISSTASSNGGFILKLQNKETLTIATPFGDKTQGTQQTFYMKVDGACPVGKVAQLDLDMFKIVPRPFDLPESGTLGTPGYKAPELITLNWLQI
jgi:hypothetical protein